MLSRDRSTIRGIALEPDVLPAPQAARRTDHRTANREPRTEAEHEPGSRNPEA
jgi:hypothetical protein